MSAHQMATIEEFCSDILILNKGKTVLQGNLKEIKEKYPANRVEIHVKQDIKNYIKEFNFEIETETNNNYVIKISDEEKAHKLLNKLVLDGINVDKFEIKKPTLNDIFKRKSFIISTLIILILIIIGFNVPNLIKMFNEDNNGNKLLIIDSKNVFEGTLENLKQMDLGYEFEITNEDLKFEDVKPKIEDKEIKEATKKQ